MPNREVRDGILTSRKVNSLTWGAEVFYRRLMSVVDDFGRYSADREILRAHLYAKKLDRVGASDVESWMAECQKAGLVRCYDNQGETYLAMLNTRWRVRACHSKWPDPPPDAGIPSPLPLPSPPRASAVICRQPPSSAAEGGDDGDSEGEADNESPPINARAGRFSTVVVGGEGIGASNPKRTPTMEEARTHFQSMGADYTPEEIKSVWQSFEGTKRLDGFWAWGKSPVTDWRWVMERRLNDDRDRKTQQHQQQKQQPYEGRNKSNGRAPNWSAPDYSKPL